MIVAQGAQSFFAANDILHENDIEIMWKRGASGAIQIRIWALRKSFGMYLA